MFFNKEAPDHFKLCLNLIRSLFEKLKWFILKKGSHNAPRMSEIVINIMIVAFVFPVLFFATDGPLLCFGLSMVRLIKQDYGSDNVDTSKAHPKPALNFFYSMCLAQGAIAMMSGFCQEFYRYYSPVFMHCHGLNRNVMNGYRGHLYLRYLNNPVSAPSLNLLSYGTGLLDSESPEDYVQGARTLNMLIEQELPIRRHLIRSSRHRIQKLIASLGWRSSADLETRKLASKIVAYLATDINLSHFPGALECISTLLDTSGQNSSDHEALSFPTESKQKRRRTEIVQMQQQDLPFFMKFFRAYFIYLAILLEIKRSWKKTDEDLILQGLIIIENLSIDQDNCTEIYNTKTLLSKITAPLRSDCLIKDITVHASWIKVVDASLRVLRKLVGHPGDTGKNMRHEIDGCRKSVENLIVILHLELEGDCGVLELQMGAIGILTHLISDESTSASRDRRDAFIERMLRIFLTDKWMEDYLEDRRKKISEEAPIQLMEHMNRGQLLKHMKRPSFMEEIWPSIMEKGNKKREEALVKQMIEEAQNTVNQLKVKAGEALAMVSMGNRSNSKAIANSTVCRDVVNCLLEMLDFKIKTTICGKCATEINIQCRISAAKILNHLCTQSAIHGGSAKKAILTKVLENLLNMNSKRKSPAQYGISQSDIENQIPAPNDTQEPFMLHRRERRLIEAALLSLYAAAGATWNDEVDGDFASLLQQLVAREDFVATLRMIIEGNTCPTPACLATLKITCEMIMLLMEQNYKLDKIEDEEIIEALSEASETVATVESGMLLSEMDHDCYGVPVKPLFSVLVKQARELFKAKKLELANNTPAARV
ncbi:hypothetical protein ACP4OV_020959 [Aristida adscensionis]